MRIGSILKLNPLIDILNAIKQNPSLPERLQESIIRFVQSTTKEIIANGAYTSYQTEPLTPASKFPSKEFSLLSDLSLRPQDLNPLALYLYANRIVVGEKEFAGLFLRAVSKDLVHSVKSEKNYISQLEDYTSIAIKELLAKNLNELLFLDHLRLDEELLICLKKVKDLLKLIEEPAPTDLSKQGLHQLNKNLHEGNLDEKIYDAARKLSKAK